MSGPLYRRGGERALEDAPGRTEGRWGGGLPYRFPAVPPDTTPLPGAPYRGATAANMPTRRPHHRRFAYLILAGALLAACTTGPHRSARGQLSFSTEDVGRFRHAATRPAATITEGATAAAPAVATKAATSGLVVLVPGLVTLLESDNAVNDMEERLKECARYAERTVNSAYFGNRPPTRAECGEELDVDGCGKPITRAMRLGQEKHTLALQCAKEVLEQLWPGSFSIEQRYRYYRNARFLETVSKAEEKHLIDQGCTRELWRTIKPDIVLHADHNLLRSVLTLDFKFPCPDTNQPKWKDYGDESAYSGHSQGKIYEEALGGDALIISPKRGLIR